jgi:hypothetical protein
MFELTPICCYARKLPISRPCDCTPNHSNEYSDVIGKCDSDNDVAGSKGKYGEKCQKVVKYQVEEASLIVVQKVERVDVLHYGKSKRSSHTQSAVK